MAKKVSTKRAGKSSSKRGGVGIPGAAQIASNYKAARASGLKGRAAESAAFSSGAGGVG